jgi:hypothetical protein
MATSPDPATEAVAGKAQNQPSPPQGQTVRDGGPHAVSTRARAVARRFAGVLVLLLLTFAFSVAWRRLSLPDAQRTAHRTQDPAPQFVDVAAASGIRFRYANGHRGMATILEENGSGCAMLDYDGDGWLDLYLPNGRDLYGRGVSLRNALYRNNADGTGGGPGGRPIDIRFTDVTERAGVPGTGYGLGVAAADYDNDGDTDLYLCQWGKNVLYRNNGDGTFGDVTDRAGVGAMEFGEPFHTGAAWLDYDRDGDLDLFVGTYVKFRQNGLRYCKLAHGIRTNCPPQMYDGTPSLLYANNGDGTFTNVTRRAGVFFPEGKALSAITCDVNEDGWTDLIVGNDGEKAWLLRNERNGRFTDIAPAAGIAYAQDGATMAAMGLDLGDYRNEGRPGFFVADFSKRPDHLWRNVGGGFFSEESSPAGIADAGFPYLGFGAGFFDANNDGWLDLFIANGHVYPEVDQSSADERYLQPNQLMLNNRDGTFREVTSEAGAGFQVRHGGRGAAFGDVDNDGDVDLLVNNNDGYAEGPPLLLRNDRPQGHFISLSLVGVASNRDAIGARVWLTAGGARQVRDVKSGGSYLSSSDRRLHFGLGNATTVERIEVRWPSGRRQTLGPLPADTFYILREGSSPTRRQFPAPARGAGR